jgi:DNA polymerase-3 subunit delta
MQLRSEQLSQQLERRLAPIYFLTGDEPLQMAEAADLVRRVAKQQGYTEREVLDQGPGFDWAQLRNAAENMSLFGEQRILDLRLQSPKVGKDGAKALIEYAEHPPSDTLLLISAPKLERSQLANKWVKTLERTGVLVQIWPIEAQRLLAWIDQRMRRVGLLPETGVREMLLERVEGNLLAAAQEIDKLSLLQGPGVVTPEQLAAAVADSARFDVFNLVDILLSGDLSRGLRVLDRLKGEGVAEAVVLWALSREVRNLAMLAFQIEQGDGIEQVLSAKRVWEKRKPLVRKGLQRPARHWQGLLLECARVDLAIKGRDSIDPWLLLQDVARGMAAHA